MAAGDAPDAASEPAPDEAATEGPSEAFLEELRASWSRHGAATIEKVRNERPHDYLRLMASNLARLSDGKGDMLDEMSDDEISSELQRTLDRLGWGRAGPGARPGTAEEP